jgi:hypothetical protein
MAKGRKATIADAELCIKLFELRREAEMRKARDYINFKFQPTCAADVIKLMQATGTQENAWFRQVLSFWENVASLALHDVVHPDLFLAWNGEMVFVYAKFAPYLKELRQTLDHPTMWQTVEKVVTGSMAMRKRLAHVRKMLDSRAAQAQVAKVK